VADLRLSPSTFAARLRATRQARGLSQAQLGVMVGLPDDVAAPRINRYEKGMNPPLDMAQKLADTLGVPLAYLMATDERLAQAIVLFAKLDPERQDAILALLRDSLDQHR